MLRKTTKEDIEVLMKIAKIEDIKSVKVLCTYEDDHAQCADVLINGAYMEFLWYDNLGFLEYWNDSPRAKQDLFNSIQHCLFCSVIDPLIADDEATPEMIAWSNRYNEWNEARIAANKKAMS